MAREAHHTLTLPNPRVYGTIDRTPGEPAATPSDAVDPPRQGLRWKGKAMTRGKTAHPMALVVAAVALTIGASTVTIGAAGPRDGNNRTENQNPDGSGEEAAPADTGEAGKTQEAPPSIEFGSAASAAPLAPDGTYEEVEPIIEEPTREQVPAAEESIATEALPVDQVGERDSDDDKIPDSIDNCPTAYNIDQSDDDGDGIGEACALPADETSEPVESDTDGDGIPDASDNCWQVVNPTQKDGDGDGLGNGCDEGSAPFLTPDEDEVVEAQRFVQEPTLTSGDPTAPEALAAPQQPVELTEGETVAAPGQDGRRRDGGESDGTNGDDERAGTGDGRTSNNEDAGEAREGGGEPERDRDDANDAPEAPPTSGGRTKVEQGERPRRNPALTEESGPVLPPPRSSKRYRLEAGYEAVVRIDAGSLAPADSDGRDRRAGDTDRPARDQPTEGRRQPRRSGSDTTSKTVAESNRDQSDALSNQEDVAQRSLRGPVPIEAGLIVDDAEPIRGKTPSEDPADRASEGAAGSTLRDTLGWQASPEPPRDALARANGRGNERVPEPRRERDGVARDARESAGWERDLHYDGGEATKRAGAEGIAGTSSDDLYLTQRAGKVADGGSFVYAIPVDTDGVYRVRLHFAETSTGADGEAGGKKGNRVFDVDAEGETAIDGLDIVAEVGSMTAVVKAFDIEVDDGTLELEFVGRQGQPIVSAIEVLRRDGDAREAGEERSR